MKSRRIALAFTLAIAAIAMWLPVNHVGAADQVPLKGTFASSSIITVNFPVVHASTDGVGQLTHFGRTTFHSEIDILIGLQTVTGTATFTAANGDTLTVIVSGTATPPNAQGMSDLALTDTLIGGTGRFTNASGSASVTGLSQATGPTTAIELTTLSGTISSVGSN
jgi:hypothetical protein